MKRIVIIGGGSGTSNLLYGLKNYPLELSAIISVMDNAGSSGRLRKELNMLPPGDLRQCLLALSRSAAQPLGTLFRYRFAEGRMQGHNLGNLIIAALAKNLGFEHAIKQVGELLKVKGQVIPVTLELADIVARLKNRTIVGQKQIHQSDLRTLQTLTLSPIPRANPAALAAIKNAQVIIIAPGDIHSSILPPLLIKSVSRTLRQSRAQKILITNLTTKPRHTDNFAVHDFIALISRHIGIPDNVVYNSAGLTDKTLQLQARKGEKLVEHLSHKNCRCTGAPLINKKFSERIKGDPIERNLIKHDAARLARLIIRLLK